MIADIATGPTRSGKEVVHAMSRRSLILALGGMIAIATAPAMAATDLTLVMGHLSFSGSFIRLPVAVTNDSQTTLDHLEVECGFYRDGGLIAAGFTIVKKLEPGTTGFSHVDASSSVGADKSQCRTVR